MFGDMSYEDNVFDVMKRIEYKNECDKMRSRLRKIYANIPQIVKDELLVREPPPNWTLSTIISDGNHQGD